MTDRIARWLGVLGITYLTIRVFIPLLLESISG